MPGLVPGGGEAFAGAFQPLLAALGQRFAPLPQRQGFLQAGAAGLQPAHHTDQLLAGVLVAEAIDVRIGTAVPGVFLLPCGAPCVV